jgi:hypothetical protein
MVAGAHFTMAGGARMAVKKYLMASSFIIAWVVYASAAPAASQLETRALMRVRRLAMFSPDPTHSFICLRSSQMLRERNSSHGGMQWQS